MNSDPTIQKNQGPNQLKEIGKTLPTNNYDLCLAWNWEYDADFAKLLEKTCSSMNVSLLQVTSNNVEVLSNELAEKKIFYRSFLDRASEFDPQFMPFIHWSKENGVYSINPHEKAFRSWNKANLHMALINAGLYTPYTIILPPFEQQPLLPSIDLNVLGDSFIIKPAHGSGGDGVVTKAISMEQVLTVRQEHPSDSYLLQKLIVPIDFGSNPAWFRIIYCAGHIYPCWWNPNTHLYNFITAFETGNYNLGKLYEATSTIANVCGLDLFSTEIALTSEGTFVVVDYVNDPVDLRIQSKAIDGVPDEIVGKIAEYLIELVTRHIKNNT